MLYYATTSYGLDFFLENQYTSLIWKEVEGGNRTLKHSRLQTRSLPRRALPLVVSAKDTLARTGQSPSRIGKKSITFYLEPGTVKQLRSLGLEENTTPSSAND